MSGPDSVFDHSSQRGRFFDFITLHFWTLHSHNHSLPCASKPCKFHMYCLSSLQDHNSYHAHCNITVSVPHCTLTSCFNCFNTHSPVHSHITPHYTQTHTVTTLTIAYSHSHNTHHYIDSQSQHSSLHTQSHNTHHYILTALTITHTQSQHSPLHILSHNTHHYT